MTKRDDQKLVLKNMIQPTKQEQLFLKMYINSFVEGFCQKHMQLLV